MRGSAVALAVVMLTAATARADGPLDPGDDKWAVHPPAGSGGKMTVQGDPASDAVVPAPPIPYPVSVSITLAGVAAGFVLVIPELSIDHVLGFRSGADKERAYIGMGTLALACGLGLGLSGGGIGSAIVGPLIEAGLIGAAFGSAYLANLALHATSNTLGQLAIDDMLGIPLLTLAIPIIAAAALFPILCAFIPGNELDREDQRAFAPVDAIGFFPLRGGGLVSVGFSLP